MRVSHITCYSIFAGADYFFVTGSDATFIQQLDFHELTRLRDAMFSDDVAIVYSALEVHRETPLLGCFHAVLHGVHVHLRRVHYHTPGRAYHTCSDRSCGCDATPEGSCSVGSATASCRFLSTDVLLPLSCRQYSGAGLRLCLQS